MTEKVTKKELKLISGTELKVGSDLEEIMILMVKILNKYNNNKKIYNS